MMKAKFDEVITLKTFGRDDTMESKLKPCPRCGDISLYVSDGDYYSGYESLGYRVSCLCHYAWNAITWCDTEEEAIAKWNSQVDKTEV